MIEWAFRLNHHNFVIQLFKLRLLVYADGTNNVCAGAPVENVVFKSSFPFGWIVDVVG